MSFLSNLLVEILFLIYTNINNNKVKKRKIGEIMNSITRYNPNIKEGLSTKQVQSRKKQHLQNYDTSIPTKSNLQIIGLNIFTLFNLLNVLLALAVFLVGSYKNLLFMGVVISNILISTIQELRAKHIIDKLSVISSTKVNVIRDKKKQEIKIDEIVLDDIVIFKTGNQIVTDSIILEGTCEVDESFITGESKPIYKKEGDMLLSGSFICSGKVTAKVEHIGCDNYTAKISKEAKYIKKVKSEIMTSLNKVLKVMAIIIVPIGFILFYQQFQINTLENAVVNTVGALIGMIPEGLVLLTSTVFAVSVLRLSKYNVLVQELYSIETLARVDTLCFDKTGTLTEGIMEVKDVIPLKQYPLTDIISNFSHSIEDENATILALKKHYPLKNKKEVLKTYPFSSLKKWSGITFKEEGSFILGAAEFILKDTSKIDFYLKKYSEEYRVLTLCHTKKEIKDVLPDDMEIIAILLLEDKIRKEAIDIIDYFQKQDVTIKLISGDNPKTVSSIAKRTGVKDFDKYIDLSKVNKDYDTLIKEYTIFGRVGPEEKKQLILALKRQNHVVGMTGDGVNDVLALKEADCSIGLGNGTEAARNVSQLVLLDTNFSSVLKVVMEGRRSINNLERSASLFLVKTIFATLLAILFLFITLPYPFMPIHLTLTSTVTVGIPSLILALEPNKNIVKGRFLTNVIGKALPAALTIVMNILLIIIFSQIYHISKEEISTLCVLSNGVIGFTLLYKICKPFNKLRKILFLSMILLFFIQAIFFYKWFSLVFPSFIGFIILLFVIVLGLGIFNKLINIYDDFVKKHPKWFTENAK